MPIRPSEIDQEAYYTVAEAAVLAACATSTLREALRAEELRGHKRGPRQWLIYGQDLANWAKGTPFEKPSTNSENLDGPQTDSPKANGASTSRNQERNGVDFGLEVSLERPESEAYATLNKWMRRRQAALFVEHGGNLGQLWKLYIAEKEAEGKTQYVRNVKPIWEANLKPKFTALTEKDLTAPRTVRGQKHTVCHEYAVERRLAGASRATVYHELNLIRTLVNWGANETRKYVTKAKVWLPRRAKPRQNQLTPEQFAQIFRAVEEPHIRLFMLLAINTAQRMSAILELTWDRVDFEKRTVDYRVNRDDADILDLSGRKGRAFVDMSGLVYTALSQEKAFQDKLATKCDRVIQFRGRAIKSVRRGIYAAVQRAGIQGKHLGSHAMRHAGATWLADRKTDMREIQKLCGHEHIDTTQLIYAGQSRGYLQNAVDILDELVSQPLNLKPSDSAPVLITGQTANLVQNEGDQVQ